jgi:4-hydroxymandelate synthase
MSTSDTQIFDGLLVDHIEFYVTDLAAKAGWFVEGLDLAVYASSYPVGGAPVGVAGPAGVAGAGAVEARSVGLGRNRVRLVLTEALVDDHPAAAYVERHGDGVADIALRVADAAAAFDTAVRRGARPVAGPVGCGEVVTATIMGIGDVAHTFVQRAPGVDERLLPGLRPPAGAVSGVATGLSEVDHFAICVAAGDLDPTVEFYQAVLDFPLIFSERIAVGSQAMTTKVVQSRSGAVTLTLIEPDVSQAAGHIDEFLKDHGGAGVQHIAFAADNIVRAVEEIGARGVEFLHTPAAYYRLLAERLELARYSVNELQRRQILVDSDHDGQLFQIFTKSVHPRNTIFFEVIERLGARGFGSGNIAALYRAVELQRNRDEP